MNKELCPSDAIKALKEENRWHDNGYGDLYWFEKAKSLEKSLDMIAKSCLKKSEQHFFSPRQLLEKP